MNDPVLGLLEYDDALGGHVSEAKAVRFLGGHRCRFVLEDYEGDPNREDLHAAVQNALAAGPSLLHEAEPYVVQYCQEMLSLYAEDERPAVHLERPSDVWSYVQFGDEFHVSRQDDGGPEDGVYLSLECNCDWEVEHGLQLILRDGRSVAKVGPFDGHLTNAHAFADPTLVGVVYRSIR